jgi:uncharacterized protein YbjT (DUF2867 family)
VALERLVAVTGATGRQGGAVARRLVAEGWRVRGLSRNPEGKPARRLAGAGVDVVRVDMADRAALVEVLRGAHAVFSVQNPMISGIESEVVQGTNVADAAKSVGVSHVVYASAGVGVAGTGVGSWESKLRIEAHMREIGLPVTVLRPTAFMELMTDRAYFPAVSTWQLMPKLMGADRPVYWISVDDVAAVAARVLADPERFLGRDVPLAADVKSIAECREIWRAVTGRAPRRLPLPVPVFERFVGSDLPTMWRWLRSGKVDVDPAETRAIVPDALTVREWLLRRQRQTLPRA